MPDRAPLEALRRDPSRPLDRRPNGAGLTGTRTSPGPSGDAVRLILLAALVLLASGLTAAPAHAHALLRASNPAEGSSVETPPTEVLLAFTEAPDPSLTVVTVIDAAGFGGHPVRIGASEVFGDASLISVETRRVEIRNAVVRRAGGGAGEFLDQAVEARGGSELRIERCEFTQWQSASGSARCGQFPSPMLQSPPMTRWFYGFFFYFPRPLAEEAG